MPDDINTYFINNLGYRERCEKYFSNCYSCNEIHGNKCKSGYYLNSDNKCLGKIDKCQNDSFYTNY
jgi:hypothetical protein